ncbi:MAG TPA: hypothetical protein VF021_05980 [Longimicrobiales bacterium]
MIQSDPEVIHQLQRLVTTQTIVAISLGIVALSALGVAIGALLAVRKVLGMLHNTMSQLTPKLDPLLASASRITGNAEEISAAIKGRVDGVLETVEDIGGRLKTGAQAVEDRVKQFGAVVDVVQAEAEDILLDAAATARGVHTAAEMLRAGRAAPPARIPDEDEEYEEDLFTD